MGPPSLQNSQFSLRMIVCDFSTSMAVEIDKNVSAHLPGTWGTPRSVKLERIPGQSLGISIVGKSQVPC